MEAGKAEGWCAGRQVGTLLLRLLHPLPHPLVQDAAAEVEKVAQECTITIVPNLMRCKGLVDLKPISWEVPAEIQWTQCCPKTCR